MPSVGWWGCVVGAEVMEEVGSGVVGEEEGSGGCSVGVGVWL